MPTIPLALLIALPFAGSCVAALLPGNARNAESTLAGLIALAGTVYIASLYPQVADGGVISQQIAWLPSLGLDLTIRMDGFAWMFSLLVMGVGSLVVLYARYYMNPADPVPRFFSFLLAFMGSMMGVVLSGNLIQLVLFWELTSLFSFLLIGYWHHRSDARRGARMALTVTGAGGLCLLVGMLLLGHIAGSFELGEVLKAGDRIRAHALYTPMLILVLLGALTKSAQFPFQFWLPHAMAAPTPVSAYLHSATMVKAGVFLMARLWPVLSGTDEWFWIVGGAGVSTLLLGAYAANFQNDLKGLLAYSTISHLGLITLLLGLNSPTATVAAVFHIMNHAIFKASLFMAAGIIDHETGTRDIRRLNGLFKAMPITATLAMVASAAMAGVPLLNGFLSKEMFFAETVYIGGHPFIEIGLPVAATLAGIFSVAYSLRFSYDIFFGPLSTDLPQTPHEPPRWMRVPVELLVLACVVVGVLPSLVVGPLLAAAALPVVGGNLPAYSLAVWHGWNLPLMMSIVALVGGLLLYFALRGQFALGRFEREPITGRLHGKQLFEQALTRLSWTARWTTRSFGTRRLQPQLLWLVGVTVLAGVLAVHPFGLGDGTRELLPAATSFVLLWIAGMACAIGAAWQAKYHRLVALLLMGGAGLVTVLTFVWFSAPDLALTQLAVEIVTTVLILLGLRWLPKQVEPRFDPRRSTWPARLHRLRDMALACAAGLGLGLLAYAVMTRPFANSISPYFLARSMPEGGGANVVNVLLVDFRGFDTFGEITVLGAVAVTVFALLRRFRPAQDSIDTPLQQSGLPTDVTTDLLTPPQQGAEVDVALGYMLIPAVLSRLMLPIALVFAVHLFMRGHNAPGGGFVAGLVVASALVLQYMVTGTLWVEERLRLWPQRWVGVGLGVALLTGLGSLAFGYPFLTTHTAHLTLPLIGELHVASALFFDIGVFALVVGATMLVLTALAHQSGRTHRRPGATA